MEPTNLVATDGAKAPGTGAGHTQLGTRRLTARQQIGKYNRFRPN